MTADEKHPITAAVIALVAVGLAVGLLLGVVTLVATHVAGLGGDDSAASGDGGPSLYLPTPVPSSSSGAPATASSAPPVEHTTPPPTHKKITLQAGEASVSAMERIDLSGVYPGGEGAVLQVQRMGEDKHWEDFPVTAAVSGGTFSTYVQTGRPGVQRFRVRDSDSGKVSNVVPVTVR